MQCVHTQNAFATNVSSLHWILFFVYKSRFVSVERYTISFHDIPFDLISYIQQSSGIENVVSLWFAFGT